MDDRIRMARPEDALALMRLFQDSPARLKGDPLFLDLRRLKEEITRPERWWTVAERDGEIGALVSLTLDAQNKVARIHRMIGENESIAGALAFLMKRVESQGAAEVVYSTTRNLTLEQQELTLKNGFKVLGVFPNAVYADPGRLNGLSAWFAPGVLDSRRRADFKLHPVIAPFYEIARKQCGLSKLALCEAPEPPGGGEGVPELEMISAPRFVAERFRQLKARKNLSVNFYPFAKPNILLTSADGKAEVFVHMVPRTRFAGILAEHLTAAVDPVRLYAEVCRMLYESRVIYVEAINDAADSQGIECILRAGFTPSGYLPCLRQASDGRRDYVVFARSYEYFTYPKLKVNSLYLDYLREYCKARAALSSREFGV
ncbi:MAG: hypothetical protein AAB578_06225 [Elusimicrobiota bacterium]